MKSSRVSSTLMVMFLVAGYSLAALAAPNNRYNGNQANLRYQQAEQEQVDRDESNASEINDESGAIDPEFATLTDDGSPESAASNNEIEGAEDGVNYDAPESSLSMQQSKDALSPWLESASADLYSEPRGQDSNIANAKVKLSSTDMSTAAGHHYHGHGVHGWLEMGAHTGKKGAFGWHDKHPVGGKGRR